MRFVLYTNSVSPHQMPLARHIADILGIGNFCYMYADRSALSDDRRALGWQTHDEPFIMHVSDNHATDILRDCNVLLSGVRDINLFRIRMERGSRTIYMSERWFKPPIGMLRLLRPQYFKMARQLVKLMRSESAFTYLPIGIHAARDMAQLCGLFSGDLRCLFRAPKLDVEKKPGGRIYLASSSLQLPTTTTTKSKRYCLDKMRMWGYFVAPSQWTTPNNPIPNFPNSNSSTLKVLWVGRLLKWKRVDTIIRAVGEHSRTSFLSNSNSKRRVTLDIYGAGPEESRLKEFASKYGDAIKFHPPVPIDEVRKLMRNHDIYILASNAYEGWGAVVSEALEEGMKVLGTYEAGSSATILPETNLFHAGDWRRLKGLLETDVSNLGILCWRANEAAGSLMCTIGM